MAQIPVSVFVSRAGRSVRNGQLVCAAGPSTLYDMLLTCVGSERDASGAPLVASEADVERVTTSQSESSDRGDATLADPVQIHAHFNRTFLHFSLKAPATSDNAQAPQRGGVGVSVEESDKSRRGNSDIYEDPWCSDEYRDMYMWLILHMNAESARLRCHERRLVSDLEKGTLQAREKVGTATHNEHLLMRLAAGGRESMADFTRVLRSLGPYFDEKRRVLERLVGL